jgi:hypothetical protein
MRVTPIALLLLAALAAGCGPRFAPRVEVPAEYSQSGQYQQAYTAFWWNCAIVKSVDLAARCPKTCRETPEETAGCSAGATDAENRIAELEKEHGPERTRQILSLRVASDDGHAQITPYFPYGPTAEKSRD